MKGLELYDSVLDSLKHKKYYVLEVKKIESESMMKKPNTSKRLEYNIESTRWVLISEKNCIYLTPQAINAFNRCYILTHHCDVDESSITHNDITRAVVWSKKWLVNNGEISEVKLSVSDIKNNLNIKENEKMNNEAVANEAVANEAVANEAVANEAVANEAVANEAISEIQQLEVKPVKDFSDFLNMVNNMKKKPSIKDGKLKISMPEVMTRLGGVITIKEIELNKSKDNEYFTVVIDENSYVFSPKMLTTIINKWVTACGGLDVLNQYLKLGDIKVRFSEREFNGKKYTHTEVL